MKTVLNYNNFSEDYRLNENVLKKAWSAVIDFFKKKFKNTAWLYYALYLKKTGQLPKEKIEIIVGYDLPDQPSEEEIKMATESLNDIKITRKITLNEKVIDLKSNDPNTRNVDVDELREEIKDVYNMNLDRVEEGLPRTKNDALFIWGAPGIGKTEVLNQVAKELGIVVQEWHLSQIEPTDFRGVPKVENILGSNDSKDRRTVSKLPSIFPTSDGNGKGGIMFFDEMNRAPEMVLAASLSLALSGKHGSYRLPPRWIVIAAGNRPTDLNLPGQDLTDDPILWNRFAHVNYAPKVGDWVEYAATQPEINPDLIAFLQFHKQYYHRYNPESKRKAWPSARSWDEASQIEYFARGENWSNKIPLKKVEEIYTDQVGKDAALDFISYLKLKEFYNEDDVRDVYEHGAKAKQPPKKLDQARAASASIAFWKKDEKLTPKELQNILDFSLNLPSIESRTGLAVFVKVAHPYIKDEEPYATIYDDFLMKWYDQLELEIGEDSDK